MKVDVGEVAYLDASTIPVEDAGSPGRSAPIRPRTVIQVGGYVLVEAEGEPNNWYMGWQRPDGGVECWGQYGDIEETLRNL